MYRIIQNYGTNEESVLPDTYRTIREAELVIEELYNDEVGVRNTFNCYTVVNRYGEDVYQNDNFARLQYV